jgi:tetratricopeptide (TPR) repeat protein
MLTMALYWPVRHNDFINYDDGDYVTANVRVQSGLTLDGVKWAFTKTVSSNWHPVTMLSHMLDCQIYGLKPAGHHLTSLLFHAFNTVLLFLWLRRATAAFWRSAAVAALFACHPMHVESVAWVSERKDVLSTCFGFLTLLFYIGYAQGRKANLELVERSPGSPAFIASPSYWLACLCFALGLMSKPMLVTWPFVLLLLDRWPLDRFQSGLARSLLIEKIPFLALAAAASLITYLVQKQAGSVMPFEQMTPGMRLENAPISYCRYVWKLLWPSDLTIFYPHPGYWPPGLVLSVGAFLCGLSAFVWLKRERFPFLLVGWFWFVGTLVPVIGLVQVGTQAMADRYTYIPSVGLFIMIVWGLYELSRPWRHQALVLALTGSAAVVLFSAATWKQIGYWKNSETLFRHALDVTSDNYIAHECLGIALARNGRLDESLGQFQAAIKFNPDFAEGHCNLANALALTGRTNDAAREYREAIRIYPDFVLARVNLATLLVTDGQTAAAIGQYREIVQLKPNDSEARYKLGNLLAKQDLRDEATVELQTAIRLNPDFVEARNNLGSQLFARGRTEEAMDQFQEAIRIKPNYADAHYNLGNIFLKSGRIDEAISQYQAVVGLSPNFAPAHYYLGVALENKGRLNDAISQFQEAVRLKPDYFTACNKLGVVLASVGRTDEAIEQWRAAIRIRPDYAEASNNLAQALEIENRPRPNR